MSDVNFYFEFKHDEKQFNRLNFILSQFYPEFNEMKGSKEDFAKYKEAQNKVINDALLYYYKEILGNVNQGNEHDGIPLIEEI